MAQKLGQTLIMGQRQKTERNLQVVSCQADESSKIFFEKFKNSFNKQFMTG